MFRAIISIFKGLPFISRITRGFNLAPLFKAVASVISIPAKIVKALLSIIQKKLTWKRLFKITLLTGLLIFLWLGIKQLIGDIIFLLPIFWE